MRRNPKKHKHHRRVRTGTTPKMVNGKLRRVPIKAVPIAAYTRTGKTITYRDGRTVEEIVKIPGSGKPTSSRKHPGFIVGDRWANGPYKGSSRRSR